MGLEGPSDGARIFKEVADEGEKLEHQQKAQGQTHHGDRSLDVQLNGIGLEPGVVELHRIGGPGEPGAVLLRITALEVDGVPGVLQSLQRGEKGIDDALRGAVQGVDSIVSRRHPLGGLSGGDPAGLHQSGDTGALMLGPEHQPAQTQGGQQQVHPQIDAQKPEKEPGIQPQDDGRADAVERGLRMGAAHGITCRS